MKLCGKSSPENLSERKDEFDSFEIYLKEDDVFDDFRETMKALRDNESIVDILHTPHVKTYKRFEKAVQKCDQMAQEFDSRIVCHSSYIRWIMANTEMDFNVKSKYGLENYIGLSLRGIERSILKKHNMVLDTAHLFLTNPGLYDRNLSYILQNHSEKISSVHLCDSTKDTDGLNIGDGIMDMEWTIQTIADSDYNDLITVEVPVNEQKESKKKILEILNS